MPRQRAIKLTGSCKLNRSCTSEIKVVSNKSTLKVSATFLKSHYGHDSEIQHLRLPKTEKADIAQKLASGISISQILSMNRDNFNPENLNRTNLLRRSDIHNIKRSFNIEIYEGVRHTEDAVSVDMFVQECSNLESNPIIFYKPQGVENEGVLKKEDFCIIIMNRVQQDILKMFAENIVAIDSTHGMNAYDFELTTLLVVDEWGEGFPGACMLTNRKDTLVFQLLFKNIRDNIGILKPKVFMSDITHVFYNAWKQEMGEVPSQLYCAWHVDRAWRSNLSKVNSPELKTLVYQSLKVLQTTNSKEEFHELLTKSINDWGKNEATVNFGQYFAGNYLSNYMQWAYCYRLNCGINTNMRLENMHKVLKHIYLDGKKVKRLDKCLNALNLFIRDKALERVIKKIKGKNSIHLKTIKSRHDIAVKSNCEVRDIIDENDSATYKWSVSSCSELDSNYIVCKNEVENCCSLICSQCDICIHSYSCTCPDFLIQHTICKHIHVVIIKKNNLLQHKSTENPGASLTEYINTLKGEKSYQSNDTIMQIISSETLKLQNNLLKNPNRTLLKHVASCLKKENSFIEATTSNNINFTKLPKSEAEPANKKIEKQIRFFSTKKKRTSKKTKISKPDKDETKFIKNFIRGKCEFISNDQAIDHDYCRSVN